MSIGWALYWRFVRRYRNSWLYAGAAATIAVTSAVTVVALPYLNKMIIDEGIMAKDAAVVLRYGAVLIGIAVIGAVSNYCYRVLMAREQNLLLTRIQADLFRSILCAREVDRGDSAGYLVSRIEHDTRNVVLLFIDRPIQSLVTLLTSLALLAITLTLSPLFAIVCLVTVLCMLLLGHRTAARIREIARSVKEAAARRLDHLSNALLGRELVRLANMQAREADGYASIVRNVFELEMKDTRIRSSADSLASMLMTLPGYAVLVVGGMYVVRGVGTLGTVIALSLYFSRLMSMTSQLINTNFDWQPALASLERIFGILDLPKEEEPADVESCTPVALRHQVEFRDVTYSYGPGKGGVKQASFIVPRGQITAIVGASGAGKTTLVRLLFRLLDPQSGSILWDGTPLDRLNPVSLRASMGLVQQDPYLFNRSVLDNLLYRCDDPGDEGMRQRAMRLVKEFKLSHLIPDTGSDSQVPAPMIGELGRNISAGEKQRLAIIRELLGNPQILVWDEATANLDSVSENIIVRTLTTVPDRTVIIIAHRLSTVHIADNIIVLRDGCVVGQGKREQIVSECDYFAGLFADQMNLQTQPAGYGVQTIEDPAGDR